MAYQEGGSDPNFIWTPPLELGGPGSLARLIMSETCWQRYPKVIEDIHIPQWNVSPLDHFGSQQKY